MTPFEISEAIEKKLEEIILGKEIVASNMLMDLKKQIGDVRDDLKSIEYKIDKAITCLKTDMEKHIIISGNEIDNSKRRLSFVEKMVFGTAGTILLAVISALVASILI